MTKTIDDVRSFWDSNPLYTGETKAKPGTVEFFEETQRIFVDDVFAGTLDPRLFPKDIANRKVLDLGCGVGMWTANIGRLGVSDLTGADLSPNSLKIAEERCRFLGVNAQFSQQNAEELTFADGTFTHVNCSGVVHHTVHPEKAVAEIARVLAPGGTALISVYYKNAILRAWPALRYIGKVLAAIGARMPGRGRDSIYAMDSVDEIVRVYDGAENPIGLAYSKAEFTAMLAPHFHIDEFYLHFFPARSLPFGIPKCLHRWLDAQAGFMIFANLRKK